MKKYKPFKEQLEMKDKETKAFGLKGSNYHLHVDDLIEGKIPIEIEAFHEICNILNLDINKLSEDKYFKCLEIIFEKIQVVYNICEKIK